MPSFDAAVEKLKSQSSWCDGAKALSELKDRRALLPLIQAFRSRAEGGKSCLLAAMRTLSPEESAVELYDRNGPGERLAALFLMEYFPHAQYLERLVQATAANSAEMRRQAREALIQQDPTPAWEDALVSLLSSADKELRLAVVEGLSASPNQRKRQALREHLAKETDLDVKRRIEQALPRL